MDARQQKRVQTINQRYGSFKKMLAKRDVRDLVLGGINGGRRSVKKGFATWPEGELSRFARQRQRDNKGRFIAGDKS